MDLLKSIDVFREVCKQMSFSRAANQLNLVPSAVSRQITELEKHLGVRLLQRTTRSVTLTEEGKRYLHKMESITEAVYDLKGETEETHDTNETIRITAAPLLGSQYLSDTLGTFIEQHPSVSISTTLVNREINLVEEGYDLALRVGELKESNLVARRVGSFSVSAVATPRYLESYGKPKHPKELAHHNCIINTLINSPGRWAFQENGRNFTVKVDGRFDANDDFLLRSFACSSFGVAFLPSYLVREQLANGELIPLLNGFIHKPLPISVVYPSRHLLSKAKRDLINDFIINSEKGDSYLG
jgi:LysR family transcriptional regulator for bpeEF and oprC